jgi:hypothetical protein
VVNGWLPGIVGVLVAFLLVLIRVGFKTHGVGMSLVLLTGVKPGGSDSQTSARAV